MSLGQIWREFLVPGSSFFVVVRACVQNFKMALTTDQSKFIDLAVRGHNVVLLGKAGTGKTYVLKKAVEILSLSKRVQVTSSTGISSTFFKQARTLHSFAGIGICAEEKDALMKRVLSKPATVQEWRDLDCLVIDEISQISARVLEAVDFVARQIRGNCQPFGGIQCIMSGDFFQLPPVSSSYDPGSFAFYSKVWKKTASHVIVLEDVVRQNEKPFVSFLERLAEGKCVPSDMDFVQENLSNEPKCDDFGVPFIQKIFAKNFDVFVENHEQLELLQGEPVIFNAKDFGPKKQLQKCIADKTLVLKIGAPVILVYNLDHQLVNGLRCSVIAFKNGLPVVDFPTVGRIETIDVRKWSFYSPSNPAELSAQRLQIPLKAAWGITAHKSQGDEYIAANVISGGEFVQGQLYVACSRVKSMKGLCLKGFNVDRLIPPSPEVLEFYKSCKKDSCIPASDNLSCRQQRIVEEDAEGFFVDLDKIDWDDVEMNLSRSEENEDLDALHDTSSNENFDFQGFLENVSPAVLEALPLDLNVTAFFGFLKDNIKRNTLQDTALPLASKEIQVLTELAQSPDIEEYLKLVWSSVKNELSVSDDKTTYQQKELTSFCSGLFSLMSSDTLLKGLSGLIGVKQIDLSIEHYSATTNLILGMAYHLLESIAVKNLNPAAMKIDGSICNDEQGKCRYVGGWVMRKLQDKFKTLIENGVTSANPDVRKRLKENIITFKLLESMTLSATAISKTTNFPHSLEVTQEKQYRVQGLTNISDMCFSFFLAIEAGRRQLLNHNRLNALKGELVYNTLQQIQNSQNIRSLWEQACSMSETNIIGSDESKMLPFKKAVSILFEEITERYMKMGTGQFLRDFRRDTKWENQTHTEPKSCRERRKKSRKMITLSLMI